MARNNPGVGNEFEILVPAYFALVINKNKEVEDFKIKSNVKGFGNLDDILVEIKMKDGRQLNFAFQLKHKENDNKNLLPSNFTAKGDFNIEKYCKTFKDLKDDNKHYWIILYTNKNFDPKRTKEVTNFTMIKDDRCEGKPFFNSASDCETIYKFEINNKTEDGVDVKQADYHQFFSKFSLYTSQNNFRGIEKKIIEILENEEVALKYTDLFRKWHQDAFTNQVIDKKTLNLQLIDVMLSPFLRENYHISTGPNDNSSLLEAAIREFDVTIIDDLTVNVIENLEEAEIQHNDPASFQLARKFKIITRFEKQLQTREELKLLYYFFGKPLIVDVNEKSGKFVYKAVELCQVKENGINLVLLGQNIDTSRLKGLSVFKNLNDLLRVNGQLYQKIVDLCQLSIQGRDEISLQEMIRSYEKIGEILEIKDLLRLLKGDHNIGEGREILPECYIPRMVSVVCLDAQQVLDHSINAKELLMVNCEGQFGSFEGLIEKKRLQVLEIDDYLNTPKQESQNFVIISKDRRCSKADFDLVCQRNRNLNVHLVKVLDATSVMLLISTNNTLKKLKGEKFYTAEDEIYSHFDGPVNVVCAQPGMGKSTMLDYLRNTCPWVYWTVKVDLKSHNSLLTKKPTSEEMLRYFMKPEPERGFGDSLKRVFLEKKRIAIFLDGLDEIETRCVDHVLGFIRDLASSGTYVWVSSRLNLQDRLEASLNVFAMDIEELSEVQQESYVTKRLNHVFKENEVVDIHARIFSSTDVTNNRNLLGIPLQLFMLTQIFLDDRRHYKNTHPNAFILTKMYRIFFEGKYRFLQQKIRSENPHLLAGKLRHLLRDYEIPALESCLSTEVFGELGLDLEDSRGFLDEIDAGGDPLGVIIRLNSEKKAVFQHYTFAEYFACVFLSKNFDKIQLLRQHLFSDKCQNLMLILNIMLAENCPLHLAVIYKNPDEIDALLDVDSLNSRDKGERNPLHIACCSGARHSRLENFGCDPYYMVEDYHARSFDGEISTNRDIIRRVSRFDPFERDKLFDWSPLEYSLASEYLFPFEAILDKHEQVFHMLKRYYDDATIAYYSARCNYPNLLSTVLQVPSIINMIGRECDSLLHIAANTEIMELLLAKGIDINETNNRGETPLHVAVEKQHHDAVNLLIERGADVHVISYYKSTTLYRATGHGNIEMMKLFLSMNVDVNVEEEDGTTALHVAVQKGHFDAVNLLVETGANVYAIDQVYGSVLHTAVAYRNIEMLELLLTKNIDVDVKDTYGRTALHEAVEKQDWDAVNMLVEKGANVHLVSEWFGTVLHRAAERGNVKMMEFFMKMKVDVNAEDGSGGTALHGAVYKGHVAAVNLLLDQSANVDAVKKDGSNGLHCGVYEGHVEIVKLLWKRGIDLRRTDVHNKRYPLYFAAKDGQLQIDLLLKMTKVIKKQYGLGGRNNIVAYLENNPLN